MNTTLRAAFFISVISHCLLLSYSGFNLNLDKTRLDKTEEMILSIKIKKQPLLPDIKKIGKEKRLKETKKNQALAKKVLPSDVIQQKTQKQAKKNINSLKQEQESVFRYQDKVKQQIQSSIKYPVLAKKGKIQGTVQVCFVISADGQAKDIKVIYSSGWTILDREAVAAIKRTIPFPEFPIQIKSDYLKMKISIVFAL